MNAGLLPIRSPRNAKQRLADLGEGGRQELALALALDALDLAASCPFLAWWVVSDDDDVRAEARARGLEVVADRGDGLNVALQLGVAAILEAGAGSVTMLPGDLPWAQPEDLRDIADTLATSSVVLVPSSDGGTNCLASSPPDLLEPRFGPGSFAAHLSEAESRKLRCTVLALDRLALDLDTTEDITTMLSERSEKPSRARTVSARFTT